MRCRICRPRSAATGCPPNYRVDLAPRTWQFIRETRDGTALFTMPPGPIKYAGAPQKIANLAADWWCRHGVLERIRPILVLPTGAMFSQPQWGEVLKDVAAGYGIEVRHHTELVDHLRPRRRREPAHVQDRRGDPQTGAGGGGGGGHLLAARRGDTPAARYDGYTSCPLVTAHNRMLLAEFDHNLTPRPSFLFLNTMKPRYDMWLLKRYGCRRCTGTRCSAAGSDPRGVAGIPDPHKETAHRKPLQPT